MDILVVNCNTSAAITRLIQTAATSAATEGTVVTTVSPQWGVESAEGFYDSYLSAAAVLELLTSWHLPVDAVVMAGFGEHGREGARQLLDVPVIDITEAAAMTACLLGNSYGIVTTADTTVEPIRQSLLTAGLLQRCAGIRACGIAVLDLAEKRDETIQGFLDTAQALLDAGADVIVLGCAGSAGLRQRLEHELGIPVVDGVAAAVGLCEGLVRAGLRTSKAGAFAAPNQAKRLTRAAQLVV